jgi:hypothetical protein
MVIHFYMNKDISGKYVLTVDNAFKIGNNEWQIRKNASKLYIIDNTHDRYISGLFKVKGIEEDSYMTFDYDGIYYLLHLDEYGRAVYIQYVNKKIN